MMCFAREVILANGVEGKLAITCASGTDTVERCCLIVIARLKAPTTLVHGVQARSISINLEYRFHLNFSRPLDFHS